MEASPHARSRRTLRTSPFRTRSASTEGKGQAAIPSPGIEILAPDMVDGRVDPQAEEAPFADPDFLHVRLHAPHRPEGAQAHRTVDEEDLREPVPPALLEEAIFSYSPRFHSPASIRKFRTRMRETGISPFSRRSGDRDSSRFPARARKRSAPASRTSMSSSDR